MLSRRVLPLCAAAVVATAAVTTAFAATPRDHAAQAWNVLPPGQAGGVAFTFRPSAQTEVVLARQFDLLRAQGERGRQAIRIVDAYVAGINAQYRRAGLPLAPWTRTDVVAVSGLIGAVFGSGGGDEVRRSQFLDLLQRKLGPEQGRRVWEDLRQRDDREANVAVPTQSGYGAQPSTEVGNVVVDAPVTPTPPAPATTRLPMSNALLVGARRSATGKPLFVAGPQVGHYYPGILLELDLEGGGYRARGAAFPGIRSPCCSDEASITHGAPPRRARTSSTSTSRRSAAATRRRTSTAESVAR